MYVLCLLFRLSAKMAENQTENGRKNINDTSTSSLTGGNTSNINSGSSGGGGSGGGKSKSSKRSTTTTTAAANGNPSSLMHYHSCRYQTPQPTSKPASTGNGTGCHGNEQQLRGRRSLSTFPTSSSSYASVTTAATASASGGANTYNPLPTSRSNTFNNRYANIIYDHHDEYGSNPAHYCVSETEGDLDYFGSSSYYNNKESYLLHSHNGNYTTTTTATTYHGTHHVGNQTPDSPNYSIAYDDVEIFNRLTRDDLAIDNSRWLSEKPISVLQLDPADRAVLKIAGKSC